MAEGIHPGMRMEWARTFTRDEVLRFAELSGDRGAHHITPDEKGRLLAHGLLTATLPTKLGGDLNFIAGTMDFEFLRPVYAGDELRCVGLVDEVAPERKRLRVKFSFTVTNGAGKRVLKGSSSGVVYNDARGS
ncbi:MAG: enoyl-CoA hydratase [Elusimicrobia bacterium]|nr:enoyl-CoA hydratase [Elusimicrobiota bacterium]